MNATPAADIHEPWHTEARQHAAMTFGFWLFLATEMLFFGGLFLCYAALRVGDPAGLAAGAHEANLAFGTANTVILTTSSVAIVIAERAVKAGWEGWARWCLRLTLALALLFLIVKGFEYRSDLHEHLWPDAGFRLAEPAARRFWAFYWTATGIHAIHITVGIGAIARLLWLDRRGLLARRWMGVEVTTLYWHFVELVWLTLYPLIYLAGRVAASATAGSLGSRAAPIAFAAIEVGIVALLFMRLASAEGLLRLAVLAGIVWSGFLFLLTFADLLTR